MITLKGTKAHPVWLVPSEGGALGALAYRSKTPALMTGGKIAHTVQVIDSARAVQTFNIFESAGVERLLAMPSATVIGLGTPTIIPFRLVYGSPAATATLIHALRQAGAQILLDTDDNFETATGRMAQTIAHFLERGARATVTDAMKSRLNPWESPKLVDRWWDDNMQSIVHRRIKALSEEWPALYRSASGVICATPTLAAALERDCGVSPVIGPNAVDPADYCSGATL